jgi:hypothetical protein
VIINVDCFDENDKFILYSSDDYGVIPNIPYELNGCISSISESYLRTVSGNVYYHWIVTKNSVTTEYFDTTYRAAFEEIEYTINY